MAIVNGLFLVVTVLITATLSGVYGMVGGMLLLWVLLLILPVSSAIAVQGVLQLVANLSRAYLSRRYADWRIIGFSTFGLVVAVSLLSLVSYEPDLAIVSLCVGLLPLSAWLPVRWINLNAARPHHAVLCGFVSGGLNIGVGVAGPIVDIFFVRKKMDRRCIIATKASLQVLSHCAKIAFYSASLSALSDRERFSIAAAAPFAILGSVAGSRILARLTDDGFRRGTLWLVTGVGAFYFMQGVYLLASR